MNNYKTPPHLFPFKYDVFKASDLKQIFLQYEALEKHYQLSLSDIEAPFHDLKTKQFCCEVRNLLGEGPLPGSYIYFRNLLCSNNDRVGSFGRKTVVLYLLNLFNACDFTMDDLPKVFLVVAYQNESYEGRTPVTNIPLIFFLVNTLSKFLTTISITAEGWLDFRENLYCTKFLYQQDVIWLAIALCRGKLYKVFNASGLKGFKIWEDMVSNINHKSDVYLFYNGGKNSDYEYFKFMPPTVLFYTFT